jgi:outer membrane protein OmpA-like peptidoglycan-associated protein
MSKVNFSLLTVTRLALIVGLVAAFNFAAATVNGQIADGQKVEKFKGVVTKREGDLFLMGDTMGGPQTTVLITSDTEVKSHKKGVFRGSKDYGATYILRGLRLEVDGTGNSEGQIVARRIRFDEQDLRTAQALKNTLDATEAELNAKLKAQQEEQERQARQLEEAQAVAVAARADAKAAADAARKAQETADYANNRINGLDDFDPIRTIVVYFNTGSSTLGPKAKQTIDEAAEWARTQDRKGWMVAVIGYADKTGNTARNRSLSEKRANSVIYYLVTNHKMQINRLVQPFGYGELDPAAANNTAEGRSKNRRVEIRLLKNKGISGNVGQTP